VLCLPIYPELTQQDQQRVIDILKDPESAVVES
jgi:dTDP-4-amino-4,6-dideoxygalactose transaminase